MYLVILELFSNITPGGLSHKKSFTMPSIDSILASILDPVVPVQPPDGQERVVKSPAPAPPPRSGCGCHHRYA